MKIMSISMTSPSRRTQTLQTLMISDWQEYCSATVPNTTRDAICETIGRNMQPITPFRPRKIQNAESAHHIDAAKLSYTVMENGFFTVSELQHLRNCMECLEAMRLIRQRLQAPDSSSGSHAPAQNPRKPVAPDTVIQMVTERPQEITSIQRLFLPRRMVRLTHRSLASAPMR
jgi:hypothetical protein